MVNIKTFYDELERVLRDYKDDLDDLATGTSCSRTSLWRWANKINKKLPDPHKIISVLAKISSLKSTKDISKHFGGEIKKFLLQSFPAHFSPLFNLQIDQESSSYISDFFYYTIYSICGTKRGATKKELINIIGNLVLKKSKIPKEDITSDLIQSNSSIALEKINELEKKNIIALNDGYYHRTKKNISLDIDMVLKFFPHIIEDFFKPEEINSGQNGIFSYTESISSELAIDLTRDVRKFWEQCHEKMKKGATKEGLPFTIINFTEKLWFDDITKRTL